jgi:O-methyltransferase
MPILSQSIVKIARAVLQFLESILLIFNVVLIRATPYLNRKRNINLKYRAWDFNRYSSLEFCAKEISDRKIQGSVAELGVYQGDFAIKINEVFPDRKLYLFDTFEGFANKDVEIDLNNGFGSKGHKVDFSDTNVDTILKRMVSSEKCIIKKGYFPETAENLEDTFAFVSIDADLYKPLYDGLNYFYPRLSKGGYIFIHDYNNALFTGAKEAVRKFSSETGVSYFPLSDDGGTAIITK